MRKKPVFIIPGFRHKPTQKAYKHIAKILKHEGYMPMPIAISWNQTTLSENTEYFLKRYRRVRTKEKYILGFSFGAMIAFLASTKVSVSGLILCSLSPYFREDILELREQWLSPTMSQRYDDFVQLSNFLLSKKVKAKKVFLLYGEREEKHLINRVKKTYTRIAARQKYLLPIANTEHTIGNKQYLQTIHYTAKVLH